jgi:hypothetical protein
MSKYDLICPKNWCAHAHVGSCSCSCRICTMHPRLTNDTHCTALIQMAAMRCDAMPCHATPCDATSPSATRPRPSHATSSRHAMPCSCHAGGRRHQTCPFSKWKWNWSHAAAVAAAANSRRRQSSQASLTQLNSSQLMPASWRRPCQVHSAPLSSTHALLAPDLSVASIMEAALAGPHERFILRWAWMNSLKSIEPEPSRSAIRKRPRSWRAL